MKNDKTNAPRTTNRPPVPWRSGLYTVRAASLLLMLAFFLPWLKIGCVQMDGSVSEEIISGHKVAWGTKLLGDDFQDRKYWLFLLSPAVIGIVSYWRCRGKAARKVLWLASLLAVACILASAFYVANDFFFSEAKPYSDKPIHRFQFYFGNWLVLSLLPVLLVCLVLAIGGGKQRGWGTGMYVAWSMVCLVAMANAGYLFSEFLLDDEPPPARVTYEICYGFWLALAACAGMLAGALITMVKSRSPAQDKRS